MRDIFSYIHYFHWQSVLDVLLVAYLFYQCSLWIRGSRALLAAVGLAVIGGIALLARWSGLILAGWLFQSLWAVIWLILIIVFQPELRRILERLSLLELLRGRRSTVAEGNSVRDHRRGFRPGSRAHRCADRAAAARSARAVSARWGSGRRADESGSVTCAVPATSSDA